MEMRTALTGYSTFQYLRPTLAILRISAISARKRDSLDLRFEGGISVRRARSLTRFVASATSRWTPPSALVKLFTLEKKGARDVRAAGSGAYAGISMRSGSLSGAPVRGCAPIGSGPYYTWHMRPHGMWEDRS